MSMRVVKGEEYITSDIRQWGKTLVKVYEKAQNKVEAHQADKLEAQHTPKSTLASWAAKGYIASVNLLRAAVGMPALNQAKTVEKTSPRMAAMYDATSTPQQEHLTLALKGLDAGKEVHFEGVVREPSAALAQAMADAVERGVKVFVEVEGADGLDVQALSTAYAATGAEVRVSEANEGRTGLVKIQDDMSSPDKITWSNWPGTVTWSPGRVYEADGVDMVQSAVQTAFEEGKRVRVVGSGHSWSDVTQSSNGDFLVQIRGLDQLEGIERLSTGEGLITVGGGMTLRRFNEILEEQGFAIKNLGTTMFQTLAGVVSTNTHGTGLDKAGFTSMVEEIEFVDGMGALRTVSRNERPELFKTVASGLGLAGIITRMTLKVDKAYMIEMVERPEKLHKLQDQAVLDKMAQENEWFQFFAFPYADTAMVVEGNRAEGKANPKPRFLETLALKYIEPTQRALTTRFPSLTPYIMRAGLSLLSTKRFTDRPERTLTYEAKESGNHGVRDVEYFFPAEYTAEVLDHLVDVVNEGHKKDEFTTQFYMLFRFLKGDDTYLSPVHTEDPDQRFAAITVPYTETAGTKKDFFLEIRNAIEAVLDRHHRKDELTVHWGKGQDGFSPEVLRERAKGMKKFEQHRTELDPAGTFASEWSKKWLMKSQPLSVPDENITIEMNADTEPRSRRKDSGDAKPAPDFSFNLGKQDLKAETPISPTSVRVTFDNNGSEEKEKTP